MSNLAYGATLDLYCEGGENAIFSSPNDLSADFNYLEQSACKMLMDRFEDKEELYLTTNNEVSEKAMNYFRGFINVNLGIYKMKMLLAVINACNKVGLDLNIINENDTYEMWSKFY